MAKKREDELLDLVNDKDEVIGTVNRSVAHKNPSLRHRGTALLLFNSKRQVLFAQRSLKKTTDPGLWTVASSGHVKAGQDPIEAVKEEAYEELGVKVDPVFVRKHWQEYETETMIYYICYSIYDGKELKIEKQEIESIQWLDLDNLDEEMKKLKTDPVTAAVTIEIAKIAFPE